MPKKPPQLIGPPPENSGDLAFHIVIGAIVIMAAIVCGSLASRLIYQ